VDVIVDSVGAATWSLSLAAVRRGGRIVTCGITTGPEATTDLQSVYWNQISVLGSTLGTRDDLSQMLQAVRVAGLRPVVDRCAPLDEVGVLMDRMETGRQFGKLALKVR
jgi:NADPH:quinone reductase-like Zn-dependent oxidoreductase